MNNLHRELAPISDAAWADIEAEARRTFTRHVAARRVVDLIGPEGETLRSGHRPPATTRVARGRGAGPQPAGPAGPWSSCGRWSPGTIRPARPLRASTSGRSVLRRSVG